MLLGYKSQWQEEEIKIPEIINSNITTVDNIENLPGYRLGQYQIDFIFPENFEYKNEYLYNFQMNNIFHSFNIIKENEDFTENNVDSNDAFFEYEEYIKDNKNNLIEYRPYDANYFANANRTFELKINVLNSEKEFDSHKEKFSTFHYGISFTSPTKYTLYFRSTFELEEMKKKDYIEKNIYTDFTKFYDTVQTANIIQILIDKAIIKTLSDSSNIVIPPVQIQKALMDQKGFSVNYKINNMQSYIPILMMIYFIPCMCSLLHQLVNEKETRVKQSLIVIGLSKSSFWISCSFVYLIIIIISSSILVYFLNLFKMFIFVQKSILFILLTLYGLSCCCIAFIFSTLVNKSKTSGVISIILCISIILSYYIDENLSDIVPNIIKSICIFTVSPVSFISLLKEIISYDEKFQYISFFSILKISKLKINLYGLSFSLILYFLLAVYLDNVLPQGNTIHRSWHFFITDLLKPYTNRKVNSKFIQMNLEPNPYIEDDHESQTEAAAVRVCDVRKSFNGSKNERKEILKGISFNAYSNEIFAILGPNGAGKTTLINIMIGVLSTTKGMVYYHNKPLLGNELEISKLFGYCSQFDAFNNNLTVGEHVRLFAGIKGLRKKDININKILGEIGIAEKKSNFPNELSGGQRRKLGIALAFLGSPKYVFLDEPTTGLDPYSRKAIWEFLSRKKEGCTIFVTTHYMDEADLLADRKMIILDGEIYCLGSSLFLKNVFNMSYTIDIQIDNLKDQYILDKLIDRYCTNCSKSKTIQNDYDQVDSPYSLIEQRSHYCGGNSLGIHRKDKEGEIIDGTHQGYLISYSLPIKDSKLFNKIFLNLNKLIKNSNNTIKNFTLTAPTLEELFIKIQSKDENMETKNKISESSNFFYAMDNDLNEKFLDNINDETSIKNSKENFLQSFNRNIIKQQDMEFLLQKSHHSIKPSSLHQIYCIVKLRLKLFIRNKNFAIIYTLLPICISLICIILGKIYINSSFDNKSFRPLHISPDLYSDGFWFKDKNIITNNSSKIIDNIDNKLLPLKIIDYKKDLKISSSSSSSSSSYDNLSISDRNFIGGFDVYDKSLMGFNGNNTKGMEESQSFSSSSYIIYYNDTYNFAMPIATDLLFNSILVDANIPEKIYTIYKPFDFQESTAKYNLKNDNSKMIDLTKESKKSIVYTMIAVVIGVTLSLTLSFYGPEIVKEREMGITHQLYLHGTSRIVYWIGGLISDCICLLIPIIIIFLGGILNGLEIFRLEYLPYIFGMTILWMIGSVLYQYIFCYFFKKYEKISNLIFIVNPIISLVIGIIIYSFYYIDEFLYLWEAIDQKKNIEPMKNYNKLYLVLLVYCPSFISVVLSELFCFIFRERNNFPIDTIQQYLSSQEVSNIFNDNNISPLKKSEMITENYLNSRNPSLYDLFEKENYKFLKFILIIIGFILIYIFVLTILEILHIKKFKKKTGDSVIDKRNKNKNKDINIDENESNINVDKIPEDILNEYKRIHYKIKNDKEDKKQKTSFTSTSDINSSEKYSGLEVFELSKNYIIDGKEMSRQRQQNRKNNSNNTLNNSEIIPRGKMKNQTQNMASQSKNNRIVYERKKKKYVFKVLDDVTFGIHRGECLGLLGPNGSGKTTMISIITGFLYSSNGIVRFKRQNLTENIKNLYNLSIGYCAQYDSLWELLTVKETIQFYINICGYPQNKISYMTESLMKASGIDKYRDKKVCEISGGTKRKLSIIISICSSPDYLILDEPSAGMDPFTRRYIWKLLTDYKSIRKPSTLLTTHSTEEAEALSDRIAILVKGKLVCIDTPKNIKMKHNDNYLLEVFTNLPQQFNTEIIKKRNIFGLGNDEEYQLESSLNHQKYSVKMKKENIANVFQLMEYAKEIGLVTQYNFGQYSLEEIFINFINNDTNDYM